MVLVNETGQTVSYTISAAGMADCGTIAVNGLVDMPGYDNQTNVQVSFLPAGNSSFTVKIPQTQAGNQVEMALLVK
jgi:peroxiredoxin